MGSMHPIALVVEDDISQRELVVVLLEESGMAVIPCASAKEAVRTLGKTGVNVSMIFIDVSLAGQVESLKLVQFATQHYPNIHVIVTSGLALTKSLPEGTMFMPKPWIPLEVLREAERSLH